MLNKYRKYPNQRLAVPDHEFQFLHCPKSSSFCFSADFSQLLRAISDYQLSTSLEILEKSGITGEQALNFIAKFRQVDLSLPLCSEEVAL
jgi:hypothetical protein